MGLLKQWADYLAAHGLDPENQLCTDDFAGHLARMRTCPSRRSWAWRATRSSQECEGDPEAKPRTAKTAREMAAQWEKLADGGEHTEAGVRTRGQLELEIQFDLGRLVRDGPFAAGDAAQRSRLVPKQRNVYGTPLDSRATYTKSDWVYGRPRWRRTGTIS